MTLKDRTKDLFVILTIYVAIGISGYLSWWYCKDTYNEIISFLIADVVMTVVCFVFSLLYKNSSVYDAYWSVIPFYFVVQWGFLHTEAIGLPQLLIFAVVSFWSWRLTLNWVRSWHGFSHEDWRYINIAKKTKVFYPIVNFLGIHLFPTLLVFAGMLPLFYIFDYPLSNSFLLALGLLVSLSGPTLQYFSDNDLANFRRRHNPVEGEILEKGLWGVIRYPNYLGEMLFWIGLSIIGAAYHAPFYTFSGAIVMVCLFLFVSIPMKERRMLERRTNYEDYQKRVPLLLPKLKR